MKLADLIAQYITLKQAHGMVFRSDSSILRSFCRFMGDIELQTVDPQKTFAFLGGNTASGYQKFKVLGGFYRFAITRGFLDKSPLPAVSPACPPPLTPYIYSVTELRKLLACTEQLRTPMSPLQSMTFRALILLLYGAGMRVGEALSLTLRDVNLADRIVTVRHTKFYKTRLVPIGPKLTRELSAYEIQRRFLPLPAEISSAFFATRTGHFLSYHRTSQIFRKLRKLAGIQRSDSAYYQPRLHDLRHTAAVHRIIDWYRKGQNVQTSLPKLSTYLGHQDISSTQRYLTLTAELLEEASRRFEQYALPGRVDHE